MTGPTSGKQDSSKTSAQRARGHGLHEATDYEHRYFVNLAATAFILALAFGMAWTIKTFDRHRTLERCLDSGRKDCRQITEAGIRSYVKLSK